MKKVLVLGGIICVSVLAFFSGCGREKTISDTGESAADAGETIGTEEIRTEESVNFTIAVVDENAPYYYQDENGEFRGFDIEYLTAVCEYSGGNAEWIRMSPEDAEDALENETVDFVLTSGEYGEAERLASIEDGLYSVPFLDCDISVWKANDYGVYDDDGNMNLLAYYLNNTAEGMAAEADQSVLKVLESHELTEHGQELLNQLKTIEYLTEDEMFFDFARYDCGVILSGANVVFMGNSVTEIGQIYGEKHRLYTLDSKKSDLFYEIYAAFAAEGTWESYIEAYRGTDGFLDSCSILVGEYDGESAAIPENEEFGHISPLVRPGISWISYGFEQMDESILSDECFVSFWNGCLPLGRISYSYGYETVTYPCEDETDCDIMISTITDQGQVSAVFPGNAAGMSVETKPLICERKTQTETEPALLLGEAYLVCDGVRVLKISLATEVCGGGKAISASMSLP